MKVILRALLLGLSLLVFMPFVSFAQEIDMAYEDLDSQQRELVDQYYAECIEPYGYATPTRVLFDDPLLILVVPVDYGFIYYTFPRVYYHGYVWHWYFHRRPHTWNDWWAFRDWVHWYDGRHSPPGWGYRGRNQPMDQRIIRPAPAPAEVGRYRTPAPLVRYPGHHWTPPAHPHTPVAKPPVGGGVVVPRIGR
ncbi:MAG: hypothetical protein HQK60_02730 [Deltaproteobacteria bacterium]|nr:hypothetical protein [Deltaproteobacteria bacterium]